MNFKQLFNLFMIGTLSLVTLATSQPAGAAAENSITRKTPIRLDAPHVEGEILVKMANVKGQSLPSLVASALAVADQSRGRVTRLAAQGTMVLSVGEADLASTLQDLNNDPAVLYAEPNYIFSLPQAVTMGDGYRLNSEYVFRRVLPSAETEFKTTLVVPIKALQAMKTRKGVKVKATYPNDPYLFTNAGWSAIGADIVWPNKTASANVCVVDTGVHKAHKDLGGSIINGYDFIWGDNVPNDENGHGTHVAGIIGALKNNKQGIAGISTGKVIAVKSLDAQGYGTSFAIAAGIQFCANRSDVKIINLSVGGDSPSQAIFDAIDYAVNTRGKLVVAAAGNDGESTKDYPAGYADDPLLVNKLIAVGASGLDESTHINYACQWPASNYGSWVSVVAPGNYIYSTLPWDISFWLNYNAGKNTRFDYMSGTSMSAAFVSAAAARYWGYKPTESNDAVGGALVSPTYGDLLDDGCWTDMSGKVQVNVAKLLDRGALLAGVFDASDGTPLWKANILVNRNNVKVGTGVLEPMIYTLPDELDPSQFYMSSPAGAEILDLPTLGGTYEVLVNKAGYTAGNQRAFQHEPEFTLNPGLFKTLGSAAVPPKTANFSVTLGWRLHEPDGLEPFDADLGSDLDLNLWLPGDNPTGIQPARFIVGNQSSVHDADPLNPSDLDDPYGDMTVFPFARLIREGGYLDPTAVEMIAFRNRFVTHSTLKVNAKLTYYPSTTDDLSGYFAYATDYGQTIDHDGDGCGDNYGANWDPDYDNSCGGQTAGIPIMGTYLTPHLYVWKDGAIQIFVDGSVPVTKSYWEPGSDCNKVWWKGVRIRSTDTAVEYTPFQGVCDNGQSPSFFPYTTP